MILDLVLKGKWYDLIASGEKLEEYREIKHYWIRRIMNCSNFFDWCMCGCVGCSMQRHPESRKKAFKKYTHVRFHRGYTSTIMTFEIESISIGKGREEWGAPTDREVFIIKLGNRLL